MYDDQQPPPAAADIYADAPPPSAPTNNTDRDVPPPPRRTRSPSPRRYRSPRERSPPRRARRGQQAPTPSKVLGAFSLSNNTGERELEVEFGKHGRVERATIVYDQRTGRSRGFGFVYMASIEDATRCIQALNHEELDGRRIRVDYSLTEAPHTATPGAYMGFRRPDRERDRGDRDRNGYYDRDRDRDRYDDRRDRDRDRYSDRRDRDRYHDDRRSSRYDDRDRDRGDDRTSRRGDSGSGNDWRTREDEIPPRRSTRGYSPRRRSVSPGGRSAAAASNGPTSSFDQARSPQQRW